MRKPFTERVADNAIEITIHMDSRGLFQTPPIGGKQYFLAVATTPHRYTQVHLLTNRTEAVDFFVEYNAWLERQSGYRVKRINADDAREFLSMRKTLRKSDIRLATSSAYSLEFNGPAERINRTLMEKVRPMLKEAGMKESFWEEALYHAAILQDRAVTQTLQNLTPHEALLGAMQNNPRIKIFGCAAYVHTHTATRKSKLDDRAELVTYLGNVEELYRIYLLHKRSGIKTKHMTFYKDKFLLVQHPKPDVFVEEGIGEQKLRYSETTPEGSSDTSPAKSIAHFRLHLRMEESEAVGAGKQTQTSDTSISEAKMPPNLINETTDQAKNSISTPEKQPRYPTRERKPPIRITINALHCTYSGDEPKTVDAMKGAEAGEWKAAMNRDVKDFTDK